MFSVHYEELLKFEELLFLKSVTVQCVVLSIAHCTVAHNLHGRRIGYGDNAWPIKCVTVYGDW